MSRKCMLTVDELDRMDDLSGAALYSAEVKRIPFIAPEDQAPYIEAARNDDLAAQQQLVMNCLNWTFTKAASVYQEREPTHSDLMDLVGHASVRMLEALPKAIHARDTVRYLMSVAALEMRLYCIYDDPMVKRPRSKPVSTSHPITVSLEAGTQPPVETVAGKDIWLTDEADNEKVRSAEYQLVYAALCELNQRRRAVVTAAYGLFDRPAMRVADIAIMLNIPKKAVENELCRGKRQLAEKLGPYVMAKGLEQKSYPQ